MTSNNRTQRSFSESFFTVFNCRYFLFHHSPLWASKYHFEIKQEQPLRKAYRVGNCNSVRWTNRTQSSFSESFLSVFILGYFHFHHSPLLVSKYQFANPTRTVLRKGFLRGNCTSVRWINTTESIFSDSLFPVFNWTYFLFHPSPLWASKYHFANSTSTALAKGFLKGKL